MQILIVGGLGHLGSALAVQLSIANHHVIIYDRDLFNDESTKNEFERFPMITVISEDEVVDLKQFDCVIWCASLDIPWIYGTPPDNLMMQNLIENNTKEFKFLLANSKEFINCSSYKCSRKILRQEDSDFFMIRYFTHLEELVVDRNVNRSGFRAYNIRIPELHGLAPRTRLDTLVHKIIISFRQKEAVVLNDNWLVKIPLMEVNECALKIIDNLKSETIFNKNSTYYNEFYSSLEIAQSIKSLMNSHEYLILTPQLTLEEIEYDLRGPILPFKKSFIHTVTTLNDQIEKNVFPDWANDIYNNGIVLEWLNKLEKSFRSLGFKYNGSTLPYKI